MSATAVPVNIHRHVTGGEDLPAVCITCPECGATIGVTDALAAPIRTQLARENQAVLEVDRIAVRKEEAQRAEERVRLEHQDLHNQLGEKDVRLAESHQSELDLRKQVRNLQDAAHLGEVERARRDDELREQIAAQVEERYAAKLRAKDEQMVRIQTEVEELRRKSSTGSAQAEGIARQQLLGESLQDRFRSDVVEVVRQGQLGADVKHVVRDQAGRPRGLILWESKRAATWSDVWIDKLKKDQRQAGADFGVIVTAALPRGQGPVIRINGVWVCDFAHAAFLGLALREAVLQVADFQAANANRADSSARVFDYIATGEFADRIISMCRTISDLDDQLGKEMRALQQSWKVRAEKNRSLETDIVSIIGDLIGRGATIPDSARFELPPA